MLTVILLAAGQSKRMGVADKLLLPFRGKTVLETTLRNIAEAKISGEILLVRQALELPGNLDFDKIPGLKIVENARFSEGMTSSIQAGISASTSGETIGFMVCLADMPFLQIADYQKIASAFERFFNENERAIVQPVFENRRGNPVVFSKFYKDEILENSEPEGCKNIVRRNVEHWKLVEMLNGNALLDLDFPADVVGL